VKRIKTKAKASPLPRMRTIKEAYAELKAKDPKTSLSEYALRRMIKTGQIPSVYTGNRYLVNMALVENYFFNTQTGILHTVK